MNIKKYEEYKSQLEANGYCYHNSQYMPNERNTGYYCKESSEGYSVIFMVYDHRKYYEGVRNINAQISVCPMIVTQNDRWTYIKIELNGYNPTVKEVEEFAENFYNKIILNKT